MARIFAPIVPPNDPRHCEPWLNRELRRVSMALQQGQKGMSAIARGEAPDASGSPLVDLSGVFLLAGRIGDQLGAGGTRAGGILTLTSTASADKGFIYLGTLANDRIAYDEDANFLGVGTDTPAVLVHANTPSAGTTTTGATGTPMFRGSYGGTTLFDLLPIQFAGGVYDTAVKPSAAFQVIATDGTAGLRLAPTSGRAYIQAGFKDSGGSVNAPAMTLGGLGATTGTHLEVAFQQAWFHNTTSAIQIGMGVGMNPTDFAGTWLGTLAVKGASTTSPAAVFMPNTDISTSSIVEFMGSAFSGKVASFEWDPGLSMVRLAWWTGATRSAYLQILASEASGKKLAFMGQSDRRELTLDYFTRYTDAVNTAIFCLGDTVSAHNGAILCGIDSSAMTRFNVTALTTLVTDVIPGGTVAASTALWHIRGSLANATVLLGIQRKSGQTGDLTDWWDSDGSTKLAFIDKDGSASFPSITITTSMEIKDSVFRIIGSADGTKKLAFEVDGFTTLTTRTLTVQNNDYIIAATNLTQTFVAGQSFIPTNSDTPMIVQQSATGPSTIAKWSSSTSIILAEVNDTDPFFVRSSFRILDATTGFSVVFTTGDILSADTTLTIPAGTGTLVTSNSTTSLINKTLLITGNILRASTASVGVAIVDNTTTTKALRFVLSGLAASTNNSLVFLGTAARTWTFPDITGTIAVSASALTSGRIPFATTGGALTDDADMTFATDTLTVTKIAATTFTGDVTLSTINLVTDGTTGTKIGTATTQKLAVWNAAPIVQPTTAIAAATFVANTSGIANDTATWDGYTIGQVVKALRNIGLLA